MRYKNWAIVAGLLAAHALWAVVQHDEHEHDDHSMDQHHAEMMHHGQQAMGFDQTKATHHFRLTAEGGYVQVQANSADDSVSRDQIRQHLQTIARQFATGDFSAPEFTHSRVPPGVPAMKQLKNSISYKYEEVDRGGRVLMSSHDPKAVSAIHEFVKFQIEEHQTGDPVEVR